MESGGGAKPNLTLTRWRVWCEAPLAKPKPNPNRNPNPNPNPNPNEVWRGGPAFLPEEGCDEFVRMFAAAREGGVNGGGAAAGGSPGAQQQPAPVFFSP